MGRQGPLYNTALYNSDSDYSSKATTQQYIDLVLRTTTPPPAETIISDAPEDKESSKEENEKEEDATTEPASITHYLGFKLDPKQHKEIPFYGSKYEDPNQGYEYTTNPQRGDHE
jgi:hypothetical protein